MTDSRSGIPTLRPCVHQPACPGCPRFAQSGIGQAAEEPLEVLCAEAGVTLETRSAEALGYRGRARLAIRGNAAEPKIGVFERGTHKIVDIPECVVHHPLINRVVAGCRRAIQRTRTSVYTEDSHRGALRYIQIVRERESGLAQVTVVANATAASLNGFFSVLTEELTGCMHSLFFSENSARTNTILSGRCVHLWGPEAVTERIGGTQVFFPPEAFGQANLGLFERIVARIHGWVLEVPETTTVCELYAGVGAIGLGLAQRGIGVRFNEIGAGSLRGLRAGLAGLPSAYQARCSVLEGDAASAIGALAGAQVVVVDPPRKGLAPQVLQELKTLARGNHAPNLIYLSCGLPSFLRDAELLRDGGYRLTNCEAYALFPFTQHVETLARFTPSSEGQS